MKKDLVTWSNRVVGSIISCSVGNEREPAADAFDWVKNQNKLNTYQSVPEVLKGVYELLKINPVLLLVCRGITTLSMYIFAKSKSK